MDPATRPPTIPESKFNRITLIAVLMTLGGITLFGYFIYAVGFREIWNGIVRFGFAGFAVILALYFGRVCVRACAWKQSVHEPYGLRLRDTVPAVVIGEAMSSTIPLGILISGTSKAVAVRRRIPLVAGLSSVATENLFYSLITGLFLISGAVLLLGVHALDEGVTWLLGLLISVLLILISSGIVMVVRQWHFASWITGWFYSKGVLRRWLEGGRAAVRQFEDLIYGFFRRHPRRFLSICIFEVLYHAFGIAEVWFILSRLSETFPSFTTAYLLESVSRLVTIMFKLIPFLIGVDEAGAEFIAETVSLGAGVGVTLAIIRKGRILFWTLTGVALIVKRGISISELLQRRR
ncbi:MAG: flippase-like domain-containing protein [Chloracidobacterium sp.]|nr:flippase-like domain-containing protein [Chloracidobacterium sp.]